MSRGLGSRVDAREYFTSHPVIAPVIARSLRRSDPSRFWDDIGHHGGREMGLRRCFAVPRR